MCLQCGHEGVADGQVCPACGMSLSEVLSPDEAEGTDQQLFDAARVDFARGTCRRALTLINHVLRRNRKSKEAWSMKGQFFQHLGYRRALKAAMQEAVRLADAEAPAPDNSEPGSYACAGQQRLKWDADAERPLRSPKTMGLVDYIALLVVGAIVAGTIAAALINAFTPP